MNTATKEPKSYHYKQVLEVIDKLTKEELAQLRVLMLVQMSKAKKSS